MRFHERQQNAMCEAFPYMFESDDAFPDDLSEVKDWCKEQFGESCPPETFSKTINASVDDYRWLWGITGHFWFRTHADAIAFKMRWC